MLYGIPGKQNVLTVLSIVSFSLFGCGCERKSPPPPPASTTSAAKPTEPVKPLVPKQEIVDWCKEHMVPESVCTRCNPSLIAEFQKKGDWCKEHNLPESQCVQCRPELKAKFEAMAPKKENG